MSFVKEVDKLLDMINSVPKSQEFVLYTYSEQCKKIIKEQHFPNVKKVVILPKIYAKTEEELNKVYIIPIDKDKFIY